MTSSKHGPSQRVVVLSAIVMLLGLGGCGIALPTRDYPKAPTATTVPAGGGGVGVVDPQDVPPDAPTTTILLPTTTAPQVTVPIPKEPGADPETAALDQLPLSTVRPVCTDLDRMVRAGAIAGGIGATSSSRSLTLTPQQKATLRSQLLEMGTEGRRVFANADIRLIVANPDQLGVALQTMLDHVRSSPASTDLRPTLDDFVSAHAPAISELIVKMKDTCQSKILAALSPQGKAS